MVASQLVRNCEEAYAAIRYLGVSGSVSEKLARLLLHWAEYPLANQSRATAGVRIRVTLTHEEISQFVGSTRETTSRVLAELREKKWITTNGSIWTITNKDALRRLAAL
jgi:CRP-like cAMP-binding protein